MEPNGRRSAHVKAWWVREGMKRWRRDKEHGLETIESTIVPKRLHTPCRGRTDKEREEEPAYLSSHGRRKRFKVLLAVHRQSHGRCR